MLVVCPRCGHTFETRASTNTRCRCCRYVVNIGRRAAPTIYTETVNVNSAPSPVAEDSILAESPGLSPVVVGVALVGAAAVGVWHEWHLRPTEGADSETLRRTRMRWCIGGGLVAALGVAVIVVSVRSA